MKKLCILLLTITILTGCGIKTEEMVETTEDISEVEVYTTETTESTAETTEETTKAITYATKIETSQSADIYGTQAFYYDDGEPVFITHEEYYTICGVVMNETGYGSYEGCIAVAQSIRNQIIREKRLGHKYDIETIRSTYGLHYTKKPNEQVRRAVTDVFYNHIVVTREPIIAWCAGGSSWHDKQILVCSYDGNNFYKIPDSMYLY